MISETYIPLVVRAANVYCEMPEDGFILGFKVIKNKVHGVVGKFQEEPEDKNEPWLLDDIDSSYDDLNDLFDNNSRTIH
jgi:hypothetical protein